MTAKRKDIMTMDGMAEYLKISKSAHYKLAVENWLPGTKFSKRWGLRRDVTDRWVQSGNPHGDSEGAEKDE